MALEIMSGRAERGRYGDSFEAVPRRWQWIFGRHAVEEVLKARPKDVLKLLVARESENKDIFMEAARNLGLRWEWSDRKSLDRLSGFAKHQGIAAHVIDKKAGDLKAFLESNKNPDAFLVALDQIQDPHNLGAIARSAANLGASGLIVPERRSASATPAAVQASAGALETISVFSVVNLAQALSLCRDHGFWLYGADMGGRPLWEAKFNRPLVLTVGSEGEGLRPLVRSTMDEIVSIPQAPGGVESFNASVAAAIMLYEIARQRGAGAAQGGKPR